MRTAIAILLFPALAIADNTSTFWNVAVSTNIAAQSITLGGSNITSWASISGGGGGGGSDITSNDVAYIVGQTGSNLFLTAVPSTYSFSNVLAAAWATDIGALSNTIVRLGYVTNSASSVSGLTLTNSGGIVTLGGTLPSGMTTSQVQGIVGAMTLTDTVARAGASNALTLAQGAVSNAASAAAVGILTNNGATVTGAGSVTVSGSLTNGGVVTVDGSQFIRTNETRSINLVSTGIQFPMAKWVKTNNQALTGGTITRLTGSVIETNDSNYFSIDLSTGTITNLIAGRVLVFVKSTSLFVSGSSNSRSTISTNSGVTFIEGSIFSLRAANEAATHDYIVPLYCASNTPISIYARLSANGTNIWWDGTLSNVTSEAVGWIGR